MQIWYAVRKSDNKVFRTNEGGRKTIDEFPENAFVKVQDNEVSGVKSKHLKYVGGRIVAKTNAEKNDVDNEEKLIALNKAKAKKQLELHSITMNRLVTNNPTYISKLAQITSATKVDEVDAIDLG